MSARGIGWALLGGVVAFGLVGPFVAGDPLVQDLSAALEGPSAAHPLGTDQFGRDMLARLAHATRISLGFALLAALVAAVPGVLLGLLAAWSGGFVDRGLAALADGVMALPGLLLVVLFAAFAPGEFLPLYIGLSLALWVEYFRVTRGLAVSLLAQPAVEAARLFGFGPWHVLWHHILPELGPLLMTLLAFSAAAAVAAISALAFVGIGMRPPTPEWGSMMTEMLPFHAEAPMQVLLPALLLALTVLGLQLVGGARR